MLYFRMTKYSVIDKYQHMDYGDGSPSSSKTGYGMCFLVLI